MLFYNGKPQKIFNVSIKKKNYVTEEDLEDVAFQSRNNYFYFFNFFSRIQCANFNGIPGASFFYMLNLNENIQAYFNNIRQLLTGVSYNPDNDLTTIDNNILVHNVDCDDIASRYMASNTINTNKINCNKIANVTLNSQQINCDSLNCNYLEYKNDISVYIYLNTIVFPLNKTISKTNLNFNDVITSIKVTIKPNYKIELWNSTQLVYSLDNNTNDIMYYQSVDTLSFTNIKIYYKHIILI